MLSLDIDFVKYKLLCNWLCKLQHASNAWPALWTSQPVSTIYVYWRGLLRSSVMHRPSGRRQGVDGPFHVSRHQGYPPGACNGPHSWPVFASTPPLYLSPWHAQRTALGQCSTLPSCWRSANHGLVLSSQCWPGQNLHRHYRHRLAFHSRSCPVDGWSIWAHGGTSQAMSSENPRHCSFDINSTPHHPHRSWSHRQHATAAVCHPWWATPDAVTSRLSTVYTTVLQSIRLTVYTTVLDYTSLGSPNPPSDDKDPDFQPSTTRSTTAADLLNAWKKGQKLMNNFWAT